ncbi:hydroxysqualene dehydroxylase HpnE [Methylophaga lonarensis]|uniref:hydroxysqualene dehydroxylase HpnE n=1 Tax=Methylophaga lonarensis TaxID=999151 RepID=UPI003D2A3331
MKCVVVGAGWSGLAAAVRLSSHGFDVTLLEAAAQPGGRARDVSWGDRVIDNGQHLMIGAYQQMFELIRDVGQNPEALFDRSPLNLVIHSSHYPSLHLNAHSAAPWPLPLLKGLMKSLGIRDFVRLLRFSSRISYHLKNHHSTVLQWCQQTAQSDRLISQLWEPLCLATMNTPINEASAQVFARVLKDSLLTKRAHADLLIAKRSLGSVFPTAAIEYLKARQHEVHFQTRVVSVRSKGNKVIAAETSQGEVFDCDQLILACHADQITRLLPAADQITFNHYPITTIYLQYPADSRLTTPMIGSSGTLSQWLFDRSSYYPGLIAVVISGPGPHMQISSERLVEHVCAEICLLQPQMPAASLESKVIREKKATFACTASIQALRPASQTSLQGLWLAGDHIAHPYPATLEAAISNGISCAQAIIKTAQTVSISQQ